MRNIWGYVVGAVLLAGAAVLVYRGVGSDKAPPRTPPATQASAPSPTAVTAPKPDKSFGKIEVAVDDITLGRADAPVTVIEYASLTCPHCALANAEVLAPMKKDYVETGKVRFVYRDFPLDAMALNASILARCAGPERFFGFLDVLFSGQSNWARNTDPLRALEQVGRMGGVPPEKFEQCRNDEELKTKILQQRMDGEKNFQINATPTLIINGDRYSGGVPYPQLKAIIDAHLSKG
jgi:protein-disulfide isomerase